MALLWAWEPSLYPIFLLHNLESSQKKDHLICLLSFKLPLDWNRFSLLITEHHIDCLWRDWQTSTLIDEQLKRGMSGAFPGNISRVTRSWFCIARGCRIREI